MTRRKSVKSAENDIRESSIREENYVENHDKWLKEELINLTKFARNFKRSLGRLGSKNIIKTILNNTNQIQSTLYEIFTLINTREVDIDKFTRPRYNIYQVIIDVLCFLNNCNLSGSTIFKNGDIKLYDDHNIFLSDLSDHEIKNLNGKKYTDEYGVFHYNSNTLFNYSKELCLGIIHKLLLKYKPSSIHLATRNLDIFFQLLHTFKLSIMNRCINIIIALINDMFLYNQISDSSLLTYLVNFTKILREDPKKHHIYKPFVRKVYDVIVDYIELYDIEIGPSKPEVSELCVLKYSENFPNRNFKEYVYEETITELVKFIESGFADLKTLTTELLILALLVEKTSFLIDYIIEQEKGFSNAISSVSEAWRDLPPSTYINQVTYLFRFILAIITKRPDLDLSEFVKAVHFDSVLRVGAYIMSKHYPEKVGIDESIICTFFEFLIFHMPIIYTYDRHTSLDQFSFLQELIHKIYDDYSNDVKIDLILYLWRFFCQDKFPLDILEECLRHDHGVLFDYMLNIFHMEIYYSIHQHIFDLSVDVGGILKAFSKCELQNESERLIDKIKECSQTAVEPMKTYLLDILEKVC